VAVRIGTSGWVYNHWRDIFYPAELKQAGWFAFYSQKFNTVEINNSFYRLPSAEMFAAWREQAPPGFLYAVKASRFLTHLKKLKDPEPALKSFFDNTAQLGEKLGPVLYQLPPHWHANLPRFESFLAALPQGYLHVVEFRDPSWLVEDVFRLMEQYQVSHCLHDMRPLEIPLRITGPIVYIRFHGDPQHAGDYPRNSLDIWAHRINDWRQHGDVYAYFNNDVSGYALKNAQELKRLLQFEG
jgi:uncharacterized protein YecE (DUF72 family)